jgi:hypothetical protein
MNLAVATSRGFESVRLARSRMVSRLGDGSIDSRSSLTAHNRPRFTAGAFARGARGYASHELNPGGSDRDRTRRRT